MNYLKSITALFVLLGCTSCGTFKTIDIKQDYKSLKKENVTTLNGIYNCTPSTFYYNNRKKETLDVTSLHILDQALLNQPVTFKAGNLLEQFATDQTSTVRIKVNTITKELLITDLVNGKPQPSFAIPYKEKRGFLYLQNQDLDITGIPVLFGGMIKNKVRIGLTGNNQLFVQHHRSSYGAILVLMMDGRDSDTSYLFDVVD